MIKDLYKSINYKKQGLYKPCFYCKEKELNNSKILFFPKSTFICINTDEWYNYWHICPHCRKIYNDVDNQMIIPVLYRNYYNELRINFPALKKSIISKITVIYFRILQHFNKL